MKKIVLSLTALVVLGFPATAYADTFGFPSIADAFLSNNPLVAAADCHFWNDGIRFTFTTAPTATPEPATMALLGSGLAGFGYVQRRRRRRAASLVAALAA